MSRRTLAAAALVGALVACRAVPTDAEATAAVRGPGPDSPDALTAVERLVDDPMVRGLVAGLGDDTARQHVAAALGAVVQAAAVGPRSAMESALVAARNEIERGDAADDAVIRAALALLLDHADAIVGGRTER